MRELLAVFEKRIILFVIFMGVFNILTGQDISFFTSQSRLPNLSQRSFVGANITTVQIFNPKLLSGRQLKLELTISGNGLTLKSNKDLDIRPVLLEGQPVIVLTNDDLAPFFDIYNLDLQGITMEEYFEADGLPDGNYNVCFELYDNTSDAYYSTGKKACQMLSVKREDPPKITQPLRHPSVNPSLPYTISWMPRHTGSGLVEYELSVFENNEALNYQDIISFNSPVLVNKSYTTSYVLLSDHPGLTKGRDYFAVVKASSNSFIFKNGGYSTPEYFTYKDASSKRSSPEACQLPNGKVFFNEISQGCGNITWSNPEYIELIAVGQGNQQFVNLEGYIIDDNNFSDAEVGNEPGHIRLGSCFSNVPAGTIILIYSNNTVNPLINPSNDNKTGGPGFWQIPFNDPCLIKYSLCPDQVNPGYTCAPDPSGTEWNKYIPMRNFGDAIQIRDLNFNLQHSLIWITSNYEYNNSPRTVRLGSAPAIYDKTFAFVKGQDWNEASNWEVRSCGGGGQSTPGFPNSPENQTLIEGLQYGSINNQFFISCSPIYSPYLGAKIETTPSFYGSRFEIRLNGQIIAVTNQTTYYANSLQPILYQVEVKEVTTGCVSTCLLDLRCKVGTPCNDFNDCTENDKIINTACDCQGTPKVTVPIQLLSKPKELCDYCSIVADESENFFYINNLKIKYQGQIIVLDGNVSGFHFPYCISSLGSPVPPTFTGCTGLRPVFDLAVDFNDWLLQNNISGSASMDGPCNCNTQRNGGRFDCINFTVTDSEAEMISYEKEIHSFEDGVVRTDYVFEKQSCHQATDLDYILSPIVESSCKPATYLWSSGQTSSSIYIPDPDACYKVTVTCSNGCSYVGMYGNNCQCIVGTPCTGPDPCLHYGICTASGVCPQPVPKPDSDSDGLCDDNDPCFGFSNIDSDHDGICDQVDCNSVSINITSEKTGAGMCNYCIDLADLLTQPNQNTTSLNAIHLTKPDGSVVELNSSTPGFTFPYCYGASTTIINENFSNGWGLWKLETPYSTLISSTGGTGQSIRLKSNTSNSNLYTNPPVTVGQGSNLEMSFNIYAVNHIAGNSIVFEVSKNGTTYTPVKTFKFNTDYNNLINTVVSASFSATSDNIYLRIRNNASGDLRLSYIDNIKLVKNPCPSDIPSLTNLKSHLTTWLNNNVDAGTLHSNYTNGPCGQGVDKLYIVNSRYRWDHVSSKYQDFVSQTNFSDFSCSGAPFGVLGYKYTASVSNCPQPVYLWSNGSTGNTIYGGTNQGYGLTVTCANGCTSTAIAGNQNCIFGSPCPPPPAGNNCYLPVNGTIDENCNCVWPPNPNADNNNNGICDDKECECGPQNADLDGDGVCDCLNKDSDGDGICDCAECTSLFILDYKPVPKPFFDHCINITSFSDRDLTNVLYTLDSVVYNLAGQPGFNFPYCEKSNGAACSPEKRTTKKFASDFYAWAVNKGWDLTSVYLDGNNGPSCAGPDTRSISIKNTRISAVTLAYGSNNVTSVVTNLGQKPAGYKVTVFTIDDCDNPKYQWSDPTITGNTVPYLVASLKIGFSVTITCGGCTYVVKTPNSNCIVGNPCDDGDKCTMGDVYDASCRCVSGTKLADDDLDGVCNEYDVCRGFDDHQDDDHDAVPNGCDRCQGFYDPYLPAGIDPVMLFDTEISAPDDVCPPGGQVLQGFKFSKPDGSAFYVDFAADPAFFELGYCLAPGLCSGSYHSQSQLIADLRKWLDENRYGGTIGVDGETGKIYVKNSLISILSISIYCIDYDKTFEVGLNSTPHPCSNCIIVGGYFVHTSTASLTVKPCYSNYYFVEGFTYIDADGNTISLEFNASSFFKPAYCFNNLGVCPQGSFTMSQFVADLQSWLNHLAYGGTVSFNQDKKLLVISNSRIKFSILDVNCGVAPKAEALGNGVAFTITTSYVNGTTGAPCDDGNECTINDTWTLDCRCAGVYSDADGDGICDSKDDCPDFPNQFDYDKNGIPDCMQTTFDCYGDKISFCEYLANFKDPSCIKKLHNFNLQKFQETLVGWFTEANWSLPGYNFPQLILELRNPGNNDSDGDGIVNFLDPCPEVKNTEEIQSVNTFLECCDPNSSWTMEKMTVLAYLIIQLQDPILDDGPGNYSLVAWAQDYPVNIFDNGPEGGGRLVNAAGCQVEFLLDCKCNITLSGPLDDVDNDGICDGDVVIGEPCVVNCVNTDPCKIVRVENCNCIYDDAPDKDNDGICDPLDQCPDGDDKLDSDGDGYPDCIDSCPYLAAVEGSSCDDGNPCTYADQIIRQVNECNCVGQGSIDPDEDGVLDCTECKIYFTKEGVTVEVDRYGPFELCPGCTYEVRAGSQQGAPCDMCPDLDDTIDENNNGLPDCLEPPYYPIGCPENMQVIPGQGIVLTFDNSHDNINIDDLPEPVGVVLKFSNKILADDYILISETRVVGDKYEVFYTFPAIGATNFEYFGISYADHQICTSDSTGILTDIPCPDQISAVNGKIKLEFDIPSTQHVDILKFLGGYTVKFEKNGVTEFEGSAEVGVSQLATGSSATSYSVTFGDATGMPDFSGYTGTVSVMLPNGVTCPFTGGALQSPCPGGLVIGSPCTPGQDTEHPECYTHYRINNNCECKGDPKPDTDDDGLCDEIDPCPEYPNSNPDGSDCDCPVLALIPGQAASLVNGTDLSVPFDLSANPQYTNVTVTISGGPPGMPQPPAGAMLSPFIISNLQRGYSYTITITATCANGASQQINIEVPDVPFDTDPALCGIIFQPINISTLTLLPALHQGDVIKASDFDVTIREAKGSYGKFTGKGYIKIPYFEQVRINVNFKDITVSADKQLVAGYINVNGYGIAVLGDPISDVINEGINDIINTLEDITDILEVLGDVLEAAEELLATSEDLVSDSAKNCVKDATELLNNLKAQAEGPNPPATIEKDIKDATANLKLCMDQYSDELEKIAKGLVSFIPYYFETIKLDNSICPPNLIDNYNALNDNYKDEFDNDWNNVISNWNDTGNEIVSENSELILEEKLETLPYDIDELETYYLNTILQYDFCNAINNLNDGINSLSGQALIDAIKLFSVVLKEVGDDSIDEIAKMIKEQKTNQQIYIEHGEKLTGSFKNVLIKKAYKK